MDWPDKWKEHEKKFLPYCLFKQLEKTVLDKIDNIRSQECSLYSHKYRVAGRVDCIAEYDGVLSIVDFIYVTSFDKLSFIIKREIINIKTIKNIIILLLLFI